MLITSSNLSTVFRGFKAAFNQGLAVPSNDYLQIATVVPSETETEEYGWLGQMPGLKKWIGDRTIRGLQANGYAIKNDPFEMTVSVPRPKIEDDKYGVYAPLMTAMGQEASSHPDELSFGLLKAGPSTLCFDGQYFFDTDHPVIAADGITVNQQANWDNNSGSGTPWYLLSTKRFLKPIIFQNRKNPEFVALTQVDDERVFMGNEFVYGVDCRRQVGYGFWQMAYGSRKTLDATNFGAAYTAMTGRLGDNGRPLNIKPDLLVVPPSLEIAARQLLATTVTTGGQNVLAGMVNVLSSAWVQ